MDKIRTVAAFLATLWIIAFIIAKKIPFVKGFLAKTVDNLIVVAARYTMVSARLHDAAIFLRAAA